MDLEDWLKVRRVIEGDIPAGWKSKRPKDLRMYNFIFRWKYDEMVAQRGGKADFRSGARDTDVKTVLAAVALTVHRMSSTQTVLSLRG